MAIAIRNRITHGDDSVDHLIVLNTVTVNFGPLIQRLSDELAKY